MPKKEFSWPGYDELEESPRISKSVRFACRDFVREIIVERAPGPAEEDQISIALDGLFLDEQLTVREATALRDCLTKAIEQ